MLGILWQPELDMLQKVDPVGGTSTWVRAGQCRSRMRQESAENRASPAPSIIDLLPSPLCWLLTRWLAFNELLTRKALGTFRSHLIQADYCTCWRWGRREGVDAPLFLAKSGSTRSPNHVSCCRHRTPSSSSRSSMRLRLMEMPFSSFQYVSRRSRVHEAKG